MSERLNTVSVVYENELYGIVSVLLGASRAGFKNLEETRTAIAEG